VALEQRRGVIEMAGCSVSVWEHCRLPDVPRSTVNYERGGPKASNVALMRGPIDHDGSYSEMA